VSPANLEIEETHWYLPWSGVLTSVRSSHSGTSVELAETETFPAWHRPTGQEDYQNGNPLAVCYQRLETVIVDDVEASPLDPAARAVLDQRLAEEWERVFHTADVRPAASWYGLMAEGASIVCHAWSDWSSSIERERAVLFATRKVYGEETARKVKVDLLAANGYIFHGSNIVGRCMAVVKGDDRRITWDSVGMERARP